MTEPHETRKRPLWLRGLALVTLVLFLVGAYLALVVSPPDVNQGQLIRMMYAHVAVAWVCFVAVIVTALYGMLFLWRGHPIDDARAAANAEVATFFAGLTLLSGMTYSKPTLNTYWTWDAKLTLTALMFALLVGYFVVRGLIDDPTRRGRVSAVVGIIVAVSLPFNYLAAAWFRTLHPTLSVAVTGVHVAPTMLFVLLFNVGVAGLVYLTFVSERVRIARLELSRSEAEERREGEMGSGEVVHV
ncbi:MAG TPA: cytochrome c biogenesis protein [Trueperaceae bacterium]|nr:cytochrome c biogenesis protein [Trueperaceae bacterium]